MAKGRRLQKQLQQKIPATRCSGDDEYRNNYEVTAS
jgi:hypothetical protein